MEDKLSKEDRELVEHYRGIQRCSCTATDLVSILDKVAPKSIKAEDFVGKKVRFDTNLFTYDVLAVSKRDPNYVVVEGEKEFGVDVVHHSRLRVVEE